MYGQVAVIEPPRPMIDPPVMMQLFLPPSPHRDDHNLRGTKTRVRMIRSVDRNGSNRAVADRQMFVLTRRLANRWWSRSSMTICRQLPGCRKSIAHRDQSEGLDRNEVDATIDRAEVHAERPIRVLSAVQGHPAMKIVNQRM